MARPLMSSLTIKVIQKLIPKPENPVQNKSEKLIDNITKKK